MPLHQGGDPYALENLQALCRRCHIEKTAAENRRQQTEAAKAWAELVAELVAGDDEVVEAPRAHR